MCVSRQARQPFSREGRSADPHFKKAQGEAIRSIASIPLPRKALNECRRSNLYNGFLQPKVGEADNK